MGAGAGALPVREFVGEGVGALPVRVFVGEGEGAREGARDGAMIGGMTKGDGATVPGINAPPTLKVKAIDTAVEPPPTLSVENACTMFLHMCKKILGQTT